MKIPDFAKNVFDTKFLKYFIFGFLAFSFEAFLFYFFKDLLPIVAANIISRGVSLFLHYFLIKNFVFFHATNTLISFYYYILLSLFNSFVSGIFIYLSFTYLYELNLIIYKILFDLILISLNFYILKIFVFSEQNIFNRTTSSK